MSFFSEIKSALNEIFFEMGQVVFWRGKEYSCIISEGSQAVELESGGFVPDETFTIKFLEDDLDGESPSIGEIIEVNGQEFRIHWVSSRVKRGQVEVSLRPKGK